MGNYRPYYSRSAVPPKYRPRDRELTGWGARLATVIDPDDDWFTSVYLEAHRVEQYGVEITDDILRNIMVRLHDEAQAALSALLSKEKERDIEPAVVYYMRISDRVKIGFTTDLKRRTGEITPEEVLATEPGGYELEQRRHLEFSRYRTRGEWFRYEGDLKEHIERLRSQPPSVDDAETMCHT